MDNISFDSGCTEKPINLGIIGLIPATSYNLLLSGFRLITWAHHSSLKYFVLLLRKHLCIYCSEFSAQQPMGHLEKCIDAHACIYWTWKTICDHSGHSLWRHEIYILQLSHFSLAIWDQNQVVPATSGTSRKWQLLVKIQPKGEWTLELTSCS